MSTTIAQTDDPFGHALVVYHEWVGNPTDPQTDRGLDFRIVDGEGMSLRLQFSLNGEWTDAYAESHAHEIMWELVEVSR